MECILFFSDVEQPSVPIVETDQAQQGTKVCPICGINFSATETSWKDVMKKSSTMDKNPWCALIQKIDSMWQQNIPMVLDFLYMYRSVYQHGCMIVKWMNVGTLWA